MRTRSLLPLLTVAAACSGIRTESRTAIIRVESTPPGAVITMENERGKQSVGAAPTAVELQWVDERVDFEPASVVTPLTFCGGTAGLMALALDDGSGSGVVGVSVAGAIVAGIVCLASGIDFVSTAASDGELVRSYYKDGGPKFAAELTGYSNASRSLGEDEPPPQLPLEFALHPTTIGAVQGQVLASAKPPATGDKEVVAVFDLVSADPLFTASVLEQLTDYLATQIAETGRYRVVPREQLRRYLTEQKKQSYQECMAESCQIELGKAAAAQLSLATKLLHVGNECALSSTLYDLKLEATSSGASVRTSCEPQQLMDGIEKLVAKLTR